jgi:seryl-tRNA synthetase
MAQVAAIKAELDGSAARLESSRPTWRLLLAVPNLPHESVPVGADESGNVEVRNGPGGGLGGSPRRWAFRRATMWTWATPLGLDFDTGVKLSGARFTVMKGPIARLHRALAQFMLDVQTQEHGYTECYTPYIVNADTLRGTGQLPKFEATCSRPKRAGRRAKPADNAALYLIPTSEVPLTNFVRDVVVASLRTAHQADRPHAVLPLRGRQRRARHARHDPPAPVRQGRDGADRAPRQSYEALEEMTGHAEAILQKLGLPYRVMLTVHRRHGFWRRQDL